MIFLQVPKKMAWEYNLDRSHSTDKSILVTSGCSFTASTQQLESAASWPGFTKDRCRFDYCIDYSYPSIGNEYIGDSILYHFSQIIDASNYMVIIMWSGLDRVEQKNTDVTVTGPRLGKVSYTRINDSTSINTDTKKLRCQKSINKIVEVYNYLRNRNISFAFSSYCNVLFPPYIPKMDTTFEFDKFTDYNTLKTLRELPWVTTDPMDHLYEYSFANNYTSGDQFHPSVECNLAWTDNVLLPGLEKQGLIKKCTTK